MPLQNSKRKKRRERERKNNNPAFTFSDANEKLPFGILFPETLPSTWTQLKSPQSTNGLIKSGTLTWLRFGNWSNKPNCPSWFSMNMWRWPWLGDCAVFPATQEAIGQTGRFSLCTRLRDSSPRQVGHLLVSAVCTSRELEMTTF